MQLRHIACTAFTGFCLVTGLISPVRAESVTVKVWMHEHPPRIPIDRAIVAEFEKANPDIKIQYDMLGAAEYSTKLLTAFASGSGPDVFNQTVSLVAAYYSSRIPATIDYVALGYADEKDMLSKYTGGFAGIRFQGKLYGVPTEVSNYACYTNNAHWREAGLDPVKDFPKTWEELPAIAEKLTKRDANGVPRRRGFDFNWPSAPAYWLTVDSLMHQLGGSVIDEESYTATFNNPAGQKMMQFFVDLVNKYKLGGPQYTDSRTDFLSGNVALDCSFGIWGVPQMKDAKIEYTVHSLPRFAGAANDNGYDAYGYYMMVNARSPSATQKAAWKFVRYYTDQATRLFQGAGLFVPRPEVTALASDADSKVFFDELAKAKFAPRVVGYAQVVDLLMRGRDRMMQGGEPVASILPGLQDDVNAVLKRERARAEAMRK